MLLLLYKELQCNFRHIVKQKAIQTGKSFEKPSFITYAVYCTNAYTSVCVAVQWELENDVAEC